MNSRVVRSVVAILAGWITGSAGCLITIMAIPIFNSEIFQAGVQLSTGWLLIMLSISAVYSIIGGYDSDHCETK